MTPCFAAKELNLLTSEYPPYVGKHLRDRGPIVEIVVEAFRHSGYRTNVYIVPWSSAIKNGAGDKFDGVFPAWHFADREASFVYSKAFVPGELVFFKKREQQLNYRQLHDLKGLLIGIVEGYRYPDPFNAANLKTIAVGKDEQNIVLLCQNNIDLALADRLVGSYIVKTKYSECANKLHWLNPTLTTTPHYLIVSRKVKDHQLKVDAFNRGLAVIEQSGQLQRILQKHRLETR